MSLHNVDLNLLIPLKALLEERSVSKAADRLRLSQPSLSTYLARLRRMFDDELLERQGNAYELTPLAVSLLERSRSAAVGLEQLFLTRSNFDPKTTDREFRIISSDYAMAALGGSLASVLSDEAPHARLRFYNMSAEVVSGAPDSLRNFDGLMMPHGFLLGQRSQDLFNDRWICAIDPGNTRVGDDLTLSQLSELPWVYTFTGRTGNLPAAQQMHLLGVEPRIDIICPNYMTVPAILRGSERVALLQHSLALPLAEAGSIRILECPFEVAPITEAFWWHPVHERDPGHLWLRRALRLAVERSGLDIASLEPVNTRYQ